MPELFTLNRQQDDNALYGTSSKLGMHCVVGLGGDLCSDLIEIDNSDDDNDDYHIHNMR